MSYAFVTMSWISCLIHTSVILLQIGLYTCIVLYAFSFEVRFCSYKCKRKLKVNQEFYTISNSNSCFFYSLQIFKENNTCKYMDIGDTSRSNWMHYVNFSYSSSQQNLIACQIGFNIYFYTIKPIPPNTELLVWYCREYAERLNVPKTGEEMLQAWSKSRCLYGHTLVVNTSASPTQSHSPGKYLVWKKYISTPVVKYCTFYNLLMYLECVILILISAAKISGMVC